MRRNLPEFALTIVAARDKSSRDDSMGIVFFLPYFNSYIFKLNKSLDRQDSRRSASTDSPVVDLFGIFRPNAQLTIEIPIHD